LLKQWGISWIGVYTHRIEPHVVGDRAPSGHSRRQVGC